MQIPLNALPIKLRKGRTSGGDHGAHIAHTVRIFDPDDIRSLLGISDDDGYRGPEDERPLPSDYEPGSEIWARELRRILASPLGATRPVLEGTPAMSSRLEVATRTMPHFSEVTGIISRAIGLSAATGRPLMLPKILLLAPPGIGKSFYMGAVARAIGTSYYPIAMNATSDRWQLSGLSSFWRYAKMGKFASGLLRCPTASPLYALDELDKSSHVPGDNVVDVLLTVLEPESAKAFVDEFLEFPVNLAHGLFIATANTTLPIPEPVLSRMMVIPIPELTRGQSRELVASIAQDVIERCAAPALNGISSQAVDDLAGLNPRHVRKVLELACPFAVHGKREKIGSKDITRSMELLGGGTKRVIGFLS